MAGKSPVDTVNTLIEAINRGDLGAALAQYEPHAILVAEPGKVATGTKAIRTALEGFIALKPTLRGDAHQFLEGGNLALFCSKWTLTGTGPDGKPVEMGGTSSDVLRRQADGNWLIVIDNPWGTALLG
ncbi:MAG: nuclear transport factor 2 family protein [Nitrospirota bacterium]